MAIEDDVAVTVDETGEVEEVDWILSRVVEDPVDEVTRVEVRVLVEKVESELDDERVVEVTGVNVDDGVYEMSL